MKWSVCAEEMVSKAFAGWYSALVYPRAFLVRVVITRADEVVVDRSSLSDKGFQRVEK